MKTFRYEGRLIPYPNTSGATITSGTVVVLAAGAFGYLGVVEDDILDQTTGALRVEGVCRLNAVTADTGNVGDVVYWDSAQSKLTTTKATNTRAGRLCAPKLNTDTVADVKLNEHALSGGFLFSNVVPATVITNTIVETLFDQNFTIPANTLRPGDVLRIRAKVSVPAQNSTDTLNLKLKIGATVIAQTGAIDVGTNDVAWIDMDVVIRTNGAGGTLVAGGVQSLGAPGTATAKVADLQSTAVDTTAVQQVGVTATWSVANAGNQARLDQLTIEKVG